MVKCEFQVCEGLKGTNPELDAILKDIFKRNNVDLAVTEEEEGDNSKK